MHLVLRGLISAGAALLVTGTLPAAWCGWGAGPIWADEPAALDALALGVSTRIRGAGVNEGDFATGAARFDGEWAFGSYMMAAMGFGQLAVSQPERRVAHLADMELALDALLQASARAYDTEAWGEDAFSALGGPNGHLAYLGYVAVPLGLHRRLVPNSRFAAQHDAIAAHLRAHLEAVPAGLVETYPGERYPVDNAVAMAGLAHHALATGGERSGLPAWSADFRRHVDPASGLLYQAVDASGAPRDAPRGSGTFFAAWFLAAVDADLSRTLWLGARDQLQNNTFGFGTMREYPRGVRGWGDIDSGPVVFGQGVSATGFAMGVARAHGDEQSFRRLYATAALVGAPYQGGSGHRWVAGGPIGDSILFAMLTTPKGEVR